MSYVAAVIIDDSGLAPEGRLLRDPPRRERLRSTPTIALAKRTRGRSVNFATRS